MMMKVMYQSCVFHWLLFWLLSGLEKKGGKKIAIMEANAVSWLKLRIARKDKDHSVHESEAQRFCLLAALKH